MNPFLESRANTSAKRSEGGRRMEISLVHKYRVRPDEPNGYFKVARQISDFMIRQAIGQKHPQGFKGEDLRAADRVQDALSDAVESERDTITLDRRDVKWIADAFEGSSAPSGFTNMASWWVKFTDYLDDALRADKAKTNGVASVPEKATA